MTSDEYAQILDDFELNAPGDVMPGESLTEYIERRRREFESKADGGSIGIEVLFREKNKNGGRIGLKDGLMPEDYLYSMDKDAKGFLIGEDSDKIPEGLPEDYLFKIDDEGKIFIVPTKESEDKRKDVEVEDVEDIIERDTPRVGILSGFSPLAFLRKYLAKKELEAKEENKADGGRVGFFMGGPALEGQALNIYNSMNAYGFSDQEIANALQGQGLYTPSGSSTPETTAPNIIGSQINQGGGGGDGPPPGPTFNRNDLLGTTDYFPNPPLGHSLKMGLGSIVDFIKSGGIIGNTIKSFAKRFQKPRVELVNKINFDAVVREQERQKEVARQAAAEAAQQRDAAIASGLDAAIREGRDTSGFDRPDSGAYAEGAGMGVGGGYASDFGYDFKDGGLATMFTRRR
jgi:hypothetical protein